MEPKFQKIISKYDYADQLAPGGFVIGGKTALTKIDGDLVGDYVIMTARDPLLDYGGDPAELLSRRLENRVLAGQSGMFTTYSGYYKGAHISIVSGGSGSPEAELILVEFMQNSKANTFLRLGGGMAISEKLHSGDVVIASGVVRDEGMTKAYVTPNYPAVCSYELVTSFVKAAEDLKYRYRVGVGRSQDSEYLSTGHPSVGSYFQDEHLNIVDYYNRAGVMYCDRESAAIVTLCSLFGRRGGAVISVDNNVFTNEGFTAGDGQDHAIDIVFEGLANLHKIDEEKKARGLEFWSPENL